ncbi:MAG TPA: hypothetical protein VD994_13475 [Prosthecobacter sp.]|nr:hypothetical protein [Prosthecobacter sp.]
MKLKNTQTRRFILPALLLAAALLGNLIVTTPNAARAQAPALEVFGTNVGRPQTVTLTPTGDFYVVDTDNRILRLSGKGGAASVVATLDYSLRDGAFLPVEFGLLSGRLLIVGGVATTNTPAFASTMDDTFSIALAPHAAQPSSLWSAAISATGFGRFAGGMLVLNQGSGRNLKDGSVDFFAYDGSLGRVANLPQVTVPYDFVLAPQGFGDVAGTLLVSDARSGGIYSVDANGQVRLFTTIPLGTGQSGLRQMAFAPQCFGSYRRHLFVSLSSGEVVVVDRKGTRVAKISGLIAPRGLTFADLAGEPSLLISDLGDQPAANPNGKVWRALPEHVVPVP